MRKSLIVALMLLFLTSLVIGQTSSGITGIVTDPSGAIIPGVKVTLLDTKTSREVNTTTNDQGSYTFNNIAPGAGYKLTFAGQGFQTFVLNDVQLGVATTITQNAQLTAGQVSEVVQVTSTTGDASLNTTDASLGNVIGQRQLRELPIQLRGTPAALIGLQPGAVGNNVFAGGGNRTGSVAGARVDQGNITVDGIDANDQATGQAFNTVANAPIDSVQEFRATTSGPNSSSGRSSGGQIDLTTQSGTNNFHGNLREYYRNEETAANSFFNNRSKVDRPALRRHQYGGSIGGPLPFPHFGEGGPIIHSGKNKLFFFFDAEIRRDRSQVTTSRTVPLQSFRDGKIGYINNTAGCGATSRVDTTPNCISYQDAATTALLDPLKIGNNIALLQFVNSRYPLPNDLTGGNGINTGLLRWNAPNVRDDKIYTTRIDSNIRENQRVFFRLTKTIRDSTNSIQFFPGDEDAVTFKDRSYAYVGGWTWVVSPQFTNVATLGMTRQANFFTPPKATPTAPNAFTFGAIGSPFPSLSYQDRVVWVPTLKDDVTYTTGNHSFQFGVSVKPIRQNATLTNDYNFPTIGLGGLTTALNPTVRPANIRTGSVAGYDAAFAFILGRVASVAANYNYTPSGSVLSAGTGKYRSYAYNEYEGYAQDNWKIRNNLTLNLGVRYHVYPAPYDRNGFQADNSTDWTQLLQTRVANAAAGTFSNSSEPFLVYNLSGKGNNGAPYYATDKNNFAPRIGFAYNPSFEKGILGAVFGERKTVLHGNFSMVYDRVGGAITFIQNQVDYLFANSSTKNYGNVNATTALLTDPRFVSLTNLGGGATTAPVITKPFTPFVTNGVANGLAGGQFNYAIDHNFKIPYAYTMNFGYQRELPGNMVIDVSYVGRIGRKLFVQSDTSQALNFKDKVSGQFLFDALNIIQPVVAANVAAGVSADTGIVAQPWFENIMNPASIASYGVPCSGLGLGNSCTALIARFQPTLTRIGDTSDLIQSLNANGLLPNNVGLSSQFATNAIITNQGNSDYHAAFVSLQKRFSKGFEFDVNYTYSKSLDNQSSQVNTVSGGLICDVLNPNACRGPSDFDIRHLFNSNFIWDLPFGRGKWIGGNVNKWADVVLGGWTLSGIISARSGLAFSAGSGSFPLGFNLASPAILSGDLSAFAANIRDTAAGIQYFKDPVAANNALRFPHHGELGNRNKFRGPNFWGLDMGLAKRIKAPWSESQRFTLRVDAFNLTNTNAFSLPSFTKDSSTFGLITSSINSPRELQFALRWDF